MSRRLLGLYTVALSVSAAACLPSTYTETSSVGPFVQVVFRDGPQLLVRECIIQFDETTTKRMRSSGPLRTSSSSTTIITEIDRSLVIDSCGVEEVSLNGAPGARP